MYNFYKRLYTLKFKDIFNNTFFSFVLNHKNNEMINKAFLYGLKWNSLSITNDKNINLYFYHINNHKMFLCSSIWLYKTFDYNNFINYFIINKFNIPLLFFKNRLFLKRNITSNIKNSINKLLIWSLETKKLIFNSLFKIMRIKKIKNFYISKIFLFFFIRKIIYKFLHNYNNSISKSTNIII